MEMKKKYMIYVNCSNHIQDGIIGQLDEPIELTQKQIDDYNNGVDGNIVDELGKELHDNTLETGRHIEEVEEEE